MSINKAEWMLLLDILEIIAARLPHGGSETKNERDLRDKLKDLRTGVKRMAY